MRKQCYHTKGCMSVELCENKFYRYLLFVKVIEQLLYLDG